MKNEFLSKFSNELKDLVIMPEIKGIFKDGKGRAFIWFKEEDSSILLNTLKLSELNW